MRRHAGLVLALGVAACGDGGPASSVTPPPNDDAGGGETPDRVALADWTPLPAASAVVVSPLAKVARDGILGPDSTDPRFVKLWWFGVSSFVASIGGHLFLFDAWEIVGAHKDYVPIGREELVALEPEAILLGHGHFDHAADAGYVAGHTGAVVVGSEEICDTAKEDAAAEDNSANFTCLITGTMDAPLPGTTQSVKLWSDLPEVNILQHVHSAATLEPQDPGVPFIHIANLLPYLVYLNTDPEEITRFAGTLGDPQGGTWAYHLRIGNFTLLWHDSAGPINLPQPFAQEIQTALDSFPDCVDVQVGAIVGFDQPLSGLRDPRLYVEHSHPKITLPTHHDAWAPVVGGGAAAYEAQWRQELASLEHPPELDYLRDPQDYMVARVYAVDDPRWLPPTPGSSCAGQP